MNTKFTVNGKEYKAREIDFAEILEFENYGLNIATISDKPMQAVVAYFGICANLDKNEAVAEFREHMVKGGGFDDVYNAMNEQLENSGFFLTLKANAEKEIAESQSKKK